MASSWADVPDTPVTADAAGVAADASGGGGTPEEPETDWTRVKSLAPAAGGGAAVRGCFSRCASSADGSHASSADTSTGASSPVAIAST